MNEVTDLTVEVVLAGAADVVRRRRLIEVEDLDCLAIWAVLHSTDPTEGLEGAERRYTLLAGDVLVQVGGEGTPMVQDHCLGEIALARGTGVGATNNALADRLDLEFRMPLTWQVCREGAAEIGIARRVARMSRHLPLPAMPVLDQAIARAIGSESGGRVLDLAEAKIIEADPDLHAQRVEAEKRRRYVSSSRTDEFGLRTVIARCDAGDAVWVEATVARVAEIMALRHPDATPGELRSIAFGWLARPAELLQLLLEHREDDQLDLDMGFDEDHLTSNRAMAMPADLLEALKEIDLAPLAPKAVLYVHIHEAAVTGAATGVARVEGLGPRTYASLAELLARTNLVVKPVIDLSDRIRTSAYEHPESLKERVYLTTNGDYWPYATSTSRRVDYDHPTPYDDTGPPDDEQAQTGTHNSGPLGRRHHRWKTHAGYRARQCGQGRYVWLTPGGLGFLVDHHGTKRISRGEAHLILDAPPGVDIYPGSWSL